MSPRFALIAAVLAVSVSGLSARALVAPKPMPAAGAPVPANQFTYTGKLTTGMMAIGGETTGTIISDGAASYELEITDALLKRKAEELSGRQVTVKGTLTVKAGIEVAQRRIIAVTSLEPAAAASAPATPVPAVTPPASRSAQ